MAYRMWETVLRLKEDNAKLGFKDDFFFIYDFAVAYNDSDLKFIISYLSHNGLSVNKGIQSFSLTQFEIEELFDVVAINLEQLAVQIENAYIQSKREKINQ